MPASDYFSAPAQAVMQAAAYSSMSAFDFSNAIIGNYPAMTCPELLTYISDTFANPDFAVLEQGQIVNFPADLDWIIPIGPYGGGTQRIDFNSTAYFPLPLMARYEWEWNPDGTKFNENITIVHDGITVGDHFYPVSSTYSPTNQFSANLPYQRYTAVDASGFLNFCVPACGIVPPPTPSPDTWNIRGTDIKLANFARIFNPFGIRRK